MATPSKDEFQIGWICALPIEAAAAKLILDETFGILQDQDSQDTNSYILGRVGLHNVVIATIGGQYGTTSAAMVANNMLRTFPKSLRIGLMVGIGGGIPSAEHDIRLGDIVISYPQGTCGGVVQHDMGKIVEGSRFERTGALNSPPRSLLTAVNNMRSTELTDDPLYPSYIQQAIHKNARTQRNFRRPDPQTDRLFQIGYEHPANAASCNEIFLPDWEVTRERRVDENPQPHYGIVASGNTVIKHAATREKLRQQTGALCFEMEAAGLMQNFSCIIIRGICDYSDSHKNKQWQGYAALAAASYAKELLRYVPRGQIIQEKLITDVCATMVKEIQGVKEELEKAFQQRQSHHREDTERAMTQELHRCHQDFDLRTAQEHQP